MQQRERLHAQCSCLCISDECIGHKILRDCLHHCDVDKHVVRVGDNVKHGLSDGERDKHVFSDFNGGSNVDIVFNGDSVRPSRTSRRPLAHPQPHPNAHPHPNPKVVYDHVVKNGNGDGDLHVHGVAVR